MIYEHVRATGAYEVVQDLSDLFNIRLQNDDFQDFDVRWDQALLATSEIPSEMVLEGLYKSKITGLCSASDCLGFVRPRNCSKQWTDKLFTIENVCNFMLIK